MSQSRQDQWAELDKHDAMAKQICNLLVGTCLERRCDVRRGIDGWHIVFRGLSETEARQIMAAIAVDTPAKR